MPGVARRKEWLRMSEPFVTLDLHGYTADQARVKVDAALRRADRGGYTGAVKPPVRRTGNRKSGPEETGIYAAEPPSRRNSFPGWGRQLIGYIIRSVPDPVRIPLSWSGSWQDRSERC